MRVSGFVGATIAALPSLGNAYTWKSVHTGGGGGFTSGIVFNSGQKGVAYARTDIGGLYRLNSDDSWTAVTDFANSTTWHDWGIDAVATDPSNANVVYAALGEYTNSWDPNNGQIGKSTNQGSTWTFANLPFKVGGNMPGRGMGERLAIDPHNSNIIYFGARSDNGLWKSTNAGASFSQVTSFPKLSTFQANPSDATGYNNDHQGFAWITFDSTSTLTNGATSRIFAGVAINTTSSLYVSNDAGSTWSALTGQPKQGFLPHKGKLSPAEHALYISYSDGSGPYDGTNGSVWRYQTTDSTWKDISPTTESTTYYGYGGLAVDYQKPGTIMVASLNSWYPDAIIFRSNNSVGSAMGISKPGLISNRVYVK
ncbi:Xyloglucanase [Thelotrema lepadinum]|nr:Xyloglucanase [Thelotrema lepadinum]